MNDQEKIEKALALLNELIDVAKIKDEKHKQESIARGKSEQAIGDSYDVFYLKLVRDILTGTESAQ